MAWSKLFQFCAADAALSIEPVTSAPARVFPCGWSRRPAIATASFIPWSVMAWWSYTPLPPLLLSERAASWRSGACAGARCRSADGSGRTCLVRALKAMQGSLHRC
jgi:hypothetical protein